MPNRRMDERKGGRTVDDQMLDICQRNGPFGLAATKREAAPLQLRVNQLAKRPGWSRREPG